MYEEEGAEADSKGAFQAGWASHARPAPACLTNMADEGTVLWSVIQRPLQGMQGMQGMQCAYLPAFSLPRHSRLRRSPSRDFASVCEPARSAARSG